MAEAGPGEAGSYVAFISYSHKDAGTGRWLHRKLEGYRLPARLAGTQGEHGEVPARLTPIFRDRDELPAAGDLSEKVRAALAASRNLIVVCSPHSAASPWVAREIATFRELHPDRPIFTAIAEGEPDQCFSPALLQGGAEPLAADLRKEGDGRRLGLLKLVAGLAGVGLDALVQRDAARRVRRVTYVTAAAVTAMLAMVLLTAVALNARAEAERQRAEAEGLVEFMLTDLRDRLKGVGRLDVLTAVNRRALAYYQKQDLEGLPAGSLERRARILHAMGEDDEKRGNLPRALAQFEEARRTTAALLAERPDDPERIFAQSQSEYWVGFIAWRTQKVDQAQAAFETYARLTRRLAETDPANVDALMEAGYAESNLATVLLRGRGDARAAEPRFKASIRHFLAASRGKPDDLDILWDVADGYGWVADSYRHQRRFAEATAERERQAALIQLLLKRDPRNKRYARGLLANALGLAQIEMDSGKAGAAAARLAATYESAARMAREDPENEELEKQRIATGLFLAKAKLLASASGRSDIASVPPLLANCAAAPARTDAEIAEFCSVLTAKYARRPPPPPRSGAAPRSRLSPRWGIDFVAERAATP
ncbi:MAG TPA: toll/interleukin-1 receptor domain-containing protein [Allosphingosinicella sp.]|nr:toll/interleukin-1 receptor domain-containing protein [Allosphingosinicella sp.]